MMRCGRALALLGVVVALAAALSLAVAGPAGAQAASPTVRFADPGIHGLEGRGQVQVVVERTDLPVSRLLVHYRTEDGPFEPSAMAQAGSDYVHTAGTLVFEVGVRSASFPVMVRDDEVAEKTEHLLLQLQTTSGESASARLTLLDDDVETASVTAAGEGAAPAAPVPATPPRSGSVAAPSAPPPVVVASSAGVRRPVAVRSRPRPAAAARPSAPRRIVLQQTPATPFELRPVPGSATGTGVATAVDPLLALGAGLLLARVSAEAWFRARIAAG